ncbi:metallophosphoesterase family protein [Candidatus Woesearchaeota archaeon]|nr:metallophosphoesterase family protein [Candidatus Woesearchaeota archaeon]
MEKHNKVLLLGDIHIGDINFTLENELVQLLNSDEFDCIVIGGDTFDPWRGESIAELMFSHRKLFEVLKHKNVIFLRGNHDNDLEELEKSGFTVRAFYEYLTSNNKKVKVLHGHEFDKYRNLFSIFASVLVYSEERINRVSKKLGLPIALRFSRLWFGLDLPTIWLALRRKHYIFSDSNYLVFGHTHIPTSGRIRNTNFYNWGSWQRDRGYRPSYILNHGDNFNIEFLPGKDTRLIWRFISVVRNIKKNYHNLKNRYHNIKYNYHNFKNGSRYQNLKGKYTKLKENMDFKVKKIKLKKK